MREFDVFAGIFLTIMGVVLLVLHKRIDNECYKINVSIIDFFKLPSILKSKKIRKCNIFSAIVIGCIMIIMGILLIIGMIGGYLYTFHPGLFT